MTVIATMIAQSGTALEAVFHEQLKGFLLSPEDVAQYLGQADEEIKAREERIRSLEAEATKARQEMDKVYRLYVTDQISPEGFGRSYRPLEERLKALEEEIPRLQGEVDFAKIQFLSWDEIVSGAQSLFERWPALSQEEKRQVVEAIVEGIRVGKEEVEIDLAYLPGSAEVGTERQRSATPALPLCRLRLRGRCLCALACRLREGGLRDGKCPRHGERRDTHCGGGRSSLLGGGSLPRSGIDPRARPPR